MYDTVIYIDFNGKLCCDILQDKFHVKYQIVSLSYGDFSLYFIEQVYYDKRKKKLVNEFKPEYNGY